MAELDEFVISPRVAAAFGWIAALPPLELAGMVCSISGADVRQALFRTFRIASDQTSAVREKRLDASGSERKGSDKAGATTPKAPIDRSRRRGNANIYIAEHADS
jgi:hypothetical protein